MQILQLKQEIFIFAFLDRRHSKKKQPTRKILNFLLFLVWPVVDFPYYTQS